jgi:hypothetical protein
VTSASRIGIHAALCALAGFSAPRAGEIPFFPVDTVSAQYARFVAYVDKALAGKPDYGYTPLDAMIRYSMSGDGKYADLAIGQVDAHVASEDSAIAAGEPPEIAHDSYLHVGEEIASLALAYDWAASRLTPQQKSRWKAYADQAIFNVWNPAQAKWGTTARPWSGWSMNDPGNNYHYSFLRATMYWAVASRNAQWLDFLKREKAPPLAAYFAKLPGGGSLEGTGYGASHRGLFEIYGFWKRATGEDLAARSTHCLSSIDYWIHATVPTLQRFAPIGDQARVSDAPLFDYQRALVARAVQLNPGTPEAARGMWWLGNISIRQMSQTFNLHDDIFSLPDAPRKPSALAYHSPGVGDLFARASWDTNATWIHVKAGLFNQSHAHQDQGSVSMYNGTWLAVTENMRTHSGIQQGTEVHNVLLFRNGTDTLRQTQGDSASRLRYEDDGAVLAAAADLSPAYAKTSGVQSWKRAVVFDRPANAVTVRDTFAVESGVSAVWQLNTPVRPEQKGDSLTAGALVVRPLDLDAQVRIVEWNALRSDAAWKAEYPSGWKIEITRPAAAVTFAVRLRVQAASTWKPAALAPRGRGQASALRWECRKSGAKISLTLHAGSSWETVPSLTLYDQRGRQIGPVLDGGRFTGPGTLRWQIPALAPGTYQALLASPGRRQATRLRISP